MRSMTSRDPFRLRKSESGLVLPPPNHAVYQCHGSLKAEHLHCPPIRTWTDLLAKKKKKRRSWTRPTPVSDVRTAAPNLVWPLYLHLEKVP